MIHKWCFDIKNPILKCFNNSFSVSLYTDENRYDLDKNKIRIIRKDNIVLIKCSSLICAGGQLKEKGNVIIEVIKNKNKISFNVDAKMNQYIRKIKLSLFNKKDGIIIGRRRYEYKTSKEGNIFNYPNGWDDLYTPLICIKNKTDVEYYRILDNVVRPKHFAIIKNDKNNIDVDMVYEEKSSLNKKHLIVKNFEIGTVKNIETIFEDQRLFIEKEFKLVKWEDRKDVPSWAKEMSLIVSLHGMHWSGYIFNTYKQMEDKLEWISKYCDPKSTCVYIPGFDGRYYYDYPHFNPNPRMGGEKGLKKLINHAHKLGFYIMPMFMINGGNPNIHKDFKEIMNESRYHSRNGYPLGVGSCDWDTGRGYDLGCGVAVNPGAPKWQDFFVKEVCKQISKFNFDAIFLDLAAIYHNDPIFDTYQGCVDIINRIHEKFPNVLIATEGCYDALTNYFPLSQCAGEGRRGLEMIYHDTPYAPMFDTYNRCFGHLCLGAPGNYKNGVFESGFNYSEYKMPLRKGIIPTITLVDDTIEKYPSEVKDILQDSLKYKKKFLK